MFTSNWKIKIRFEGWKEANQERKQNLPFQQSPHWEAGQQGSRGQAWPSGRWGRSHWVRSEKTGHCEGGKQSWAWHGFDLVLIRICPTWQWWGSKFHGFAQHNSCQKNAIVFGQHYLHCYWGWCKCWWGLLRHAVCVPRAGRAEQERVECSAHFGTAIAPCTCFINSEFYIWKGYYWPKALN